MALIDRLKRVAATLYDEADAALGTAANPFRVNTVASTVQPVSVASWFAGAAVTATVNGQTKDAGPAWTASWGVSGLPVIADDFTASGLAVTAAPVQSQSLVITDINLSATLAMVVNLFAAGIASPFWREHLSGSGGVQRTWRSKFKLPVGATVVAQASASGNLAVLLGYYSEA